VSAIAARGAGVGRAPLRLRLEASVHLEGMRFRGFVQAGIADHGGSGAYAAPVKARMAMA